jgi:hypothetical protein
MIPSIVLPCCCKHAKINQIARGWQQRTIFAHILFAFEIPLICTEIVTLEPYRRISLTSVIRAKTYQCKDPGNRYPPVRRAILRLPKPEDKFYSRNHSMKKLDSATGFSAACDDL